MDTKEITVSDLAQEQIKNAERLFPLIRKKTEERKEKNDGREHFYEGEETDFFRRLP